MRYVLLPILLITAIVSCSQKRSQPSIIGKWMIAKFYSPNEEALYNENQSEWRQNEFNKIKDSLYFEFKIDNTFTIMVPGQKPNSGKWNLSKSDTEIICKDISYNDNYYFKLIKVTQDSLILEFPLGPKDRFELVRKK